jgi:hypothetical protein
LYGDGGEAGLVVYLCDRNFSVVPDVENIGDIAWDGYLGDRTGTVSHRNAYACVGERRHTYLELRLN